MGVKSSSEDVLTLPAIFSNYGFLNMWSSENITINGTTTTMHDYAGLHDLSNPTALSQPTYNASDSNFGGKPSFSFANMTSILKANVANWRGSDTSGVFVEVVKLDSGTIFNSFTTADENTTSFYVSTSTQGTTFRVLYVALGTFNNSTYGQSDVILGLQPNVLAHGSTGSEYKIWIGGRSETVTMAAGLDDGTWLDQIPNRDNIAIGLERSTGIGGGDFTTVFVGYLPYTNHDTINAAINDLNKYYKI
jgi:hypothetical protein